MEILIIIESCIPILLETDLDRCVWSCL